MVACYNVSSLDLVACFVRLRIGKVGVHGIALEASMKALKRYKVEEFGAMADGLTLENVSVETYRDDKRKGFVFDSVQNLKIQ